MRPFVVNGHGRLVFPSNFSADLDFSVLETLEQLEAVVKRDFEAKAPTGTEILERVEAGDYDSRAPAAARPGHEPGLGQPLRDDDVREAPDAVARPAAPPRRRLPAAADAVGAGRAQGRGGRDGVGRAPRHLGRRGRGPDLREPVRASSATSATTRPSCRPSSRPWRRSRAIPANLTFCLPDHDPDHPTHSYQEILDCNEAVPELEPLHRLAMVLHNQYPWDLAQSRLEEVGKIGDDDFVVAFVPRNHEVLEFIRRVQGASVPPRPRPAPPAEARAPVAPLLPDGRARAVRAHAAPRVAGGRQGRARLHERGHHPQRGLQLVADDRRRHRGQDGDPRAALHGAPARAHLAAGGPRGARGRRAPAGGDRRGHLLLVHEHDADPVRRDLALRAARDLPDPRLVRPHRRLRGLPLRPGRGGAAAPGGQAAGARRLRREVLGQDRHRPPVADDLRRRRGRARRRARRGRRAARHRGRAGLRERPGQPGQLDHLAQPRVRQQPHRLRPGGEGARRALPRPDDGRAAATLLAARLDRHRRPPPGQQDDGRQVGDRGRPRRRRPLLQRRDGRQRLRRQHPDRDLRRRPRGRDRPADARVHAGLRRRRGRRLHASSASTPPSSSPSGPSRPSC